MVVPDFTHNQFRVCLEKILLAPSSSSTVSSSSHAPPSPTPGIIDGLSYGAVEALRLVQSAFVSAVVDEVANDPTYDDDGDGMRVLQESQVRAALSRLGMSDLADRGDDVISRASAAEAKAGEDGRGDDEMSGGRGGGAVRKRSIEGTLAGARRGRRRKRVRITDDMLAEQERLLAGSAERVTAATAAASAAAVAFSSRPPSSTPPPEGPHAGT